MSRSHQHRRKLPEADYIPQARRALLAHTLRERAAEDELQAKRACASAMNTHHIREFEFANDEGKRFKAKLKRPLAQRVSVRKLYTLVREGVLSLDDFLDSVTANDQIVEETLGEDRTKSLMEEYRKGLNLVITPK